MTDPVAVDHAEHDLAVVARVCYESARAFEYTHGDSRAPAWDDAEPWRRAFAGAKLGAIREGLPPVAPMVPADHTDTMHPSLVKQRDAVFAAVANVLVPTMVVKPADAPPVEPKAKALRPTEPTPEPLPEQERSARVWPNDTKSPVPELAKYDEPLSRHSVTPAREPATHFVAPTHEPVVKPHSTPRGRGK